MKYFILIIISMTIVISAYASVEDVARINRSFSHTDGRFGFDVDTYPVNANNDVSCHSEDWADTWFGFEITPENKHMVAALLTAQAQNREIKIASEGCLGNWHNVRAIYVH